MSQKLVDFYGKQQDKNLNSLFNLHVNSQVECCEADAIQFLSKLQAEDVDL